MKQSSDLNRHIRSSKPRLCSQNGEIYVDVYKQVLKKDESCRIH